MRYKQMLLGQPPEFSGTCSITPDGTTDAGGSGGQAPNASAETPATQERVFTQAEVDRLSAEARRQGRDTGRKEAKRETDQIVALTRDKLIAEFREQGLLPRQPAATGGADPAAAGTPSAAATPPADEIVHPAAVPPADKSKVDPGTGGTDDRYTALERRIAAQEETIRASEAARRRIEKEREQERSDRKQAQEAARKEHVITEVAGALSADAQIPDRQARALAKLMITENKIIYDDKRVLFVTDDDDLDAEDGGKIKLPLKDGIAAWGKTAAADEYRPPVRPGSGTSDRGNGFPQAKAVKPEDMTELERYKAADAQTRHIFNQQRAQAQRT